MRTVSLHKPLHARDAASIASGNEFPLF